MVKLEVIYEGYDRCPGGTGVHRHIIKRNSLLEALKVMVDKMQLYIDSEQIEEDNMSAEEVIQSIEESNGDGCDFIFSLKDLQSGKVYIPENNYDSEEEW